MSRVKNVLNSDRRMSVRMIPDKLSLSLTQVFEIVTGTLAMRKVCTKFVPRVLCGIAAPSPQKSRRGPTNLFSVSRNKTDAQGESSRIGRGGSTDHDDHLFSFYLHAGLLTTHFDGEVEAIHIALQQLAVRLPPIERAVILSDPTSALQALSNYNENNCLRVQNCRELLGKIKGNIVFQWVPSHCGLWGNERADFFAKKGTGILQNFRRDLTLHSAKLEIKRIFRESFRLTASRVARDKP
ncbi:RNase H domain-containing protein [Trichonephila clavipes]|nr:RNase H domain-containing protein [Trichonephila clavipes]